RLFRPRPCSVGDDGMSGADAIPLLLGCAVLASCTLAWFGLAELRGGRRNSLAARLQRIAGKSGAAPQDAVGDAVRRDITDSSIAGLDRLIKRYLPHPAKLRERLARTGRRITIAAYVLACLLAAGITYLLLETTLHWPLLVALPASVTVGLAVPHKVIEAMIAA